MLPPLSNYPTIACDIAEYGRRFPVQKTQKGDFAVTAGSKMLGLLQGARLSKSVMNFHEPDNCYPVKLGHKYEELGNLWQDKYNQLKPPQFNGKQLCIYHTKSSEETEQLKLVRSDYLSVAISRAQKPEFSPLPLRDFYNCGVAVCFKTSDNKYLVSENAKHQLRFPGGFILGDKTDLTHQDIDKQLLPIELQEKSFTDLVVETAIKETQEEVLDIYIKPEKCKILCGIGKDFVFPSKSKPANLKSVHCFKSICVSVETALPSRLIEILREKYPPVDQHELPKIHFIDCNAPLDATLAERFILEHKNFYQFMSNM